MECDNINKRKRWLVEAVANGSQPAIDVLKVPRLPDAVICRGLAAWASRRNCTTNLTLNICPC